MQPHFLCVNPQTLVVETPHAKHPAFVKPLRLCRCGAVLCSCREKGLEATISDGILVDYG